MVFFRFAGALVGFFFGFFLAAQLLQISQVTPPNNQVLVVLLLAVAGAKVLQQLQHPAGPAPFPGALSQVQVRDVQVLPGLVALAFWLE